MDGRVVFRVMAASCKCNLELQCLQCNLEGWNQFLCQFYASVSEDVVGETRWYCIGSVVFFSLLYFYRSGFVDLHYRFKHKQATITTKS